MTESADLVVRDGRIHTLEESDTMVEAMAIRDGEIVRLGSSYDVSFLVDPDTTVLDVDGRVVLPGFIDAHTHLTNVGRYLVHADLSGAPDRQAALDRLHDRADETDGPVLGYGYDESGWPDTGYLTRSELDAVADDRPVIAFREDMHVASVNSTALDRHRESMPDDDVQTDAGDPTGVVVEEAVDPLYAAVEPDRAGTRELVEAAQRAAVRRGVTAIHDKVRKSHAPRVYRDLDAEDALDIRVRIDYWADHLDALIELGERTNHGTDMVETGAVKTYTDGSFGGRTAKLSEPYADGDTTGQWVVAPEELREIVGRADDHGFQLTVHAIGDAAIRETIDAFEATSDPASARHRIEHVELADDALIDRIADSGVIASVQPNFLKWAGKEGLYADRLGNRRRMTNRYRTFHERGAHLAFGSDCMPMDPLLGVHHAVNAPEADQRLGVTEALRAYTAGAAYAGFDEDRLGTLEVGKRGDFVVLDASPWDATDAIRDIDVTLTAVDGTVRYDGR